MARILDGRALAKEINKELADRVKTWVAEGHNAPHLTCIQVGNDPASETYVNNKAKNANEVGIKADVLKLSSSISEDDLLQKINTLNADEKVDGILVQLPLPTHIDERTVCNAVDPRKDVDGFHVENVGKLCLDLPSMVPATPLGVVELLKKANVKTFGSNVVVVGRSKNVGMPIAMLLHSDGKHESGLGMDATVTICHRHTPKELLTHHCKHADIIVSATGIPKLISADMVKSGATVIDVGITRVTDANGKTKLVGDVDFEEVSKIAGAVTPVPGGVGPMTVAMLMQNTFQVAQAKDRRKKTEDI